MIFSTGVEVFRTTEWEQLKYVLPDSLDVIRLPLAILKGKKEITLSLTPYLKSKFTVPRSVPWWELCNVLKMGLFSENYLAFEPLHLPIDTYPKIRLVSLRRKQWQKQHELTVTSFPSPSTSKGEKVGNKVEPGKEGEVQGRHFKDFICFSLSFSDFAWLKIPLTSPSGVCFT